MTFNHLLDKNCHSVRNMIALGVSLMCLFALTTTLSSVAIVVLCSCCDNCCCSKWIVCAWTCFRAGLRLVRISVICLLDACRTYMTSIPQMNQADSLFVTRPEFSSCLCYSILQYLVFYLCIFVVLGLVVSRQFSHLNSIYTVSQEMS